MVKRYNEWKQRKNGKKKLVNIAKKSWLSLNVHDFVGGMSEGISEGIFPPNILQQKSTFPNLYHRFSR